MFVVSDSCIKLFMKIIRICLELGDVMAQILGVRFALSKNLLYGYE